MSHDPEPARVPSLQELLNRWFVSKDRAALDLLLAGNMDFLRRYAHGKLGKQVQAKEDTGDVVQDAIIEFLRYSPPFVIASEAQLRGLLCKIVDGVLSGHHRWFARMRREVARERPLPDGTSVVVQPFVADDPSPSHMAQDHEREAALRLAIATLDPTDQRIVMMRTYQNAPFEEIGEAVGMKADTARVRYGRALSRLSGKVRALGKGQFDEFLA